MDSDHTNIYQFVFFITTHFSKTTKKIKLILIIETISAYKRLQYKKKDVFVLKNSLKNNKTKLFLRIATKACVSISTKSVLLIIGRVPKCNGFGAACYDPRFVGGDGVIFYFRGKSNEHFSLVSDPNLQINARFIGFRPPGRAHDYTWIQALGILFGQHNFSLEATKATTWDNNIDHLKFSYDGNEVLLPERHLSVWNSPERNLNVERISSKNSVILSLDKVLEIAVNAMPVTKEDDKIHNYQIPNNNCYVHLDVQFRFFRLSPDVEGVLGRTYQPNFKNPAKAGVSMPVVGGEDKYRTASLLSADCKSCLFSPSNISEGEELRDFS